VRAQAEFGHEKKIPRPRQDHRCAALPFAALGASLAPMAGLAGLLGGGDEAGGGGAGRAGVVALGAAFEAIEGAAIDRFDDLVGLIGHESAMRKWQAGIRQLQRREREQSFCRGDAFLG